MLDDQELFVACFPDPILARPAGKVDQITDDIRLLAEKMIDHMLRRGGVGLAGPHYLGNFMNRFVVIPPAIDPTVVF